MMAMAIALLAVSDAPVTLSAVRLEADNGRPVVRAVVSGPVAARVDRDGRDLVLVLPGAHAGASLVLPEPVAEIQSFALEDAREGARLRIRLESALAYEMTVANGVVSVAIRAGAPAAPARRAPGNVRDLYARILPPPAGEPVPPAGERAPEAESDHGEGLRLGPIHLRPSVVFSYVDVAAALLDTPEPVRDKYFQIEPHLGFTAGGALPGEGRFLLTYEPRFRVGGSFPELRRPTHLATASVDMPIGAFITLRGRHHFAKGLLETTEVDPGREYFFRLAPFTRYQTDLGINLNPGGLVGIEVDATRDSVHIEDGSGFFNHRTDSVLTSLVYQFGTTSRAYLRYEWDHVPAPAERPIVESTSSSVSIGASGELMPLLRGDVSIGVQFLDAPQAAPAGRQYRGNIATASLRKEFTPSVSLSLLGRRGTYPSGFEQNAFYVVTGAGVETDLGLPLSVVFHGGVGWQRNAYRVPAAGLSVPRRDDIVGWSVGAGRSLTRWSFLRADYRHDRRRSNLAAFDTNGHVFMVQLGVGYLGEAPTGAVPK